MNKILEPEQIKKIISQDPYSAIYNLSKLSLPKMVELLMMKRSQPIRLEAFQQVILNLLWTKKFPMLIMGRGSGKTWIMAVYAILRAFLNQGSKIVVVGSGFRQSKLIFGYIQEIIDSSPLLQEALYKWHGRQAGVKYATDKVFLKVGTSELAGLPIGDGSKIRGFRATHLMCDETASIDDKVFDIAIAPFLSVHADPAINAATTSLIKKLKKIDAPERIIKMVQAQLTPGNQLILSGTASYEFNHFYRRYMSYKMFIESKGDPKKIREAIESQNPDPTRPKIITDQEIKVCQKIWDKYCIIQIPYYALPEGFLEESVISTHKSQMNPIIFSQEYECLFAKDSFGFFPRSIIHAASPGADDTNVVHYEVFGDPKYQYVMGLDPARHNDNFGLVVLKLVNGVAKVVYVDAWRKTDYPRSVEKIRDVLKRFPNVIKIAMDAGGGGYAVRDLLINKDFLKPGEQPIIEIDEKGEVVEEKNKFVNGLRILELVNFHTWSVSANYQMLADITTKKLLFPSYIDDDKIRKQTARALNKSGDILNQEELEMLTTYLYGELDLSDDLRKDIEVGVVANLNACIDETCNIVRTVTQKGTESFELPNLSEQIEGLDIRRRDRFSALLLAAYAARQVKGTGHNTGPRMEYYGGTVDQIIKEARNINPMSYRNGVYY